MEFQDWMFDKRVIKRNLRKGIVNPRDLERYLKSLQDVSEKVASNTPNDETSDETDSEE